MALADRYTRRYGPGDLGQPLLVETRLRMTSPDGLPLAGTLDRVAYLDEGCCNRLQASMGIRLIPGRYLIDFKTKRRNEAIFISQMRTTPQWAAYVALWDATHPDEPLEGILISTLYRYVEEKPEQFALLTMPLPDEAAYAALWSLLRDAARNVRERGMDHCNPLHCYDWMRPCPGLDECSRVNEVPHAL